MLKCSRCKKNKNKEEFHKSKRNKSGFCEYCKECKSEYNKLRRDLNLDLTKQKRNDYYKKNRIKILKHRKDWNSKNKEKEKSYRVGWLLDNKDYFKRRYSTDSDFKRNNLLRTKNKNNLKRAIKYYLEGKTDKLPSKSPSKLLLKLYELQNNTCIYCSSSMVDNIHIDHIIPLSKNGSNEVDNLILCCSKCNLSKNNKDLNIWLEECCIDYNTFISEIEERNKLFI